MSASISARLFDDASSATGEPATLMVENGSVQVRARDRIATCRIADLRVREVGFGADMGYELAWDDSEGTHAVHVLDAESVAALCSSAFATAPQVQGLSRRTRKRAAAKSLAWLFVLTIVAFPLVTVLVLMWQADRIAQGITNQIPLAHEIALGDAAFESLRPSLALKDNGVAYEAVRQLGVRLTQGSVYPYRFHVAEDEAINAFALPGGIIVVHTGLIAATRTPEELAGVLAHEIEHVEQRHSLHAAVKSLGLRAVWAWLTGDVGATIGGQAALKLTLRKFSRDAERAADVGALRRLVEKRIDPTGLVTFFTTMAERREGELPEMLSTHPADAERERLLRSRVADLRDLSFSSIEIQPWPPQR